MASKTFKRGTGKDALGWDESQARTWDALCRDTAPTALAQLRIAAIQAALCGADVLPAAPPAARNAPAAVSEPAARAADLLFYTGTAPLPARGGQPCPPGIPPIGLPPPRPPASSTSPATGKPASSASPASHSSSAGQHGADGIRPAPVAPLQHPPGSPRHLTRDDRKEVTRRNCYAMTLSHAELERGHRPENSDCNTGYLEDWTWNATLSGAPQGGVASPVLSNIYLDRLDKFAESVLIPEYTRGKSRKANPVWTKVANAMAAARRRGDRAAVLELRQQRRGVPARDPGDPGYRRLRYTRYADDHLFGFTGPKAEAEQITQRLADFLREDLKLELSLDKTLITHGPPDRGRGRLGQAVTSPSRIPAPSRRRMGAIGLPGHPGGVIQRHTRPILEGIGKPGHRPELMNLDDPEIISAYGAEYRGLAQYYLLAGNVSRLHRLCRAAKNSTLKTLAANTALR